MGNVEETGVGIGEEMRIALTPFRGDFSDDMMDETRDWLFGEVDFVSSILILAGRAFSIFFDVVGCRCGAGVGTGPVFCS